MEERNRNWRLKQQEKHNKPKPKIRLKERSFEDIAWEKNKGNNLKKIRDKIGK